MGVKANAEQAAEKAVHWRREYLLPLERAALSGSCACIAADKIVTDGPEKESAWKVIEQHIWRGLYAKQGQIYWNSDKYRIGIGYAGAEQAKAAFSHTH